MPWTNKKKRNLCKRKHNHCPNVHGPTKKNATYANVNAATVPNAPLVLKSLQKKIAISDGQSSSQKHKKPS